MFLLVPVDDSKSQPLSWTPHHQDTVKVKTVDRGNQLSSPDDENEYTTGKTIVVPLDDQNLLGRGPKCSIKFISLYMSNKHAEIRKNSGNFEIRDLGSLNGTSINGIRLKPESWFTLSTNNEISLAGVKAMVVDFNLLRDVVKMIS
jgi:hypothetical protein